MLRPAPAERFRGNVALLGSALLIECAARPALSRALSFPQERLFLEAESSLAHLTALRARLRRHQLRADDASEYSEGRIASASGLLDSDHSRRVLSPSNSCCPVCGFTENSRTDSEARCKLRLKEANATIFGFSCRKLANTAPIFPLSRLGLPSSLSATPQQQRESRPKNYQ